MADKKKPHHFSGNNCYRIPEERYAAARAIYEATPGLSYDRLSAQVGISARALENRGSKEGWAKRELLPPAQVSEAAQVVADHYKAKLSDFGPEITDEEKAVAVRDTALELAVKLRADIIDRHRKEWAAIRNLVYKSIKDNKSWQDDHESKRAKILAETLQIMQSNERKAWGIPTTPETEQQLTIVIERE
jgi:hypothetical protein